MYPVMHVPAGDVLPIMFSTYAGATGASVTLTGLAVTDIEIYKDGGVTQRASDAGYTLLDTDGIDFDGITGIHGFSIDTGDNTDAGFYTVGAWFTVVVSAVTVDSQTVNFVAAMFRIMPAESSAGVPKSDVSHFGGTAGTFASGVPAVNAAQLSGDATAADNAEAFFDGTGYAGTNNVIPTVTTVTNLHASAATAAELAKVPKSDGTASWNATALAAINAQADTAISDAALATAAELAKVPKSDGTASWNATALAAINAQADTALADYDGPTNAEMVARTLAAASYATAAAQATAQADLDLLTGTDGVTLATSQPNYAPATAASVAALNDLSAAQVNAEVDAAIETYHLDHLLAVTYDPAAKPGAADALLNELVESDAGVARYTANALEQAPSGTGASAADIADAVWEEAIADHSGTAGSTAEALNAAGAAGDPWVTALPGAYSAGQAGYIVGTNVNATVSSRASQTSVDDLPTNAELATALGTADDAVLAAIAALNNLSSAQAQTAAAAALTAYDPPTRAEATSDANSILSAVGDVPTNAELTAALAAADDAVLAAIAALNNVSAADVNAQLVDALNTDTYAQPGQGAPPATATMVQQLGYLYKAWRNRTTQTATEYALYADDGITKDQEAAVSDDTTTFERGEIGTGA